MPYFQLLSESSYVYQSHLYSVVSAVKATTRRLLCDVSLDLMKHKDIFGKLVAFREANV